MSLKNVNIRNSVLFLVIVAAASTRFLNLGSLGSWSNFTPIGAMALFGGAYFSNKVKAYGIPLLTLLASDMLLNFMYYQKVVVFYEGAFWVYLSFALMVFAGTFLKKINVSNVLLASVAAVFIHWLVADLGTVLAGTMYPKTFNGYMAALIAAIPFERNLLVSNILYGALMFGGFELAKSKFKMLSYKPSF